MRSNLFHLKNRLNQTAMNTSSAKERRALILRMLEQKEEVSVIELSRTTGISEVTIRKDLTILQARHLLLRTRGGAMRKPIENINEDTAISKKRMFNFREKQRIGEEAARMIKEGDFPQAIHVMAWLLALREK